MTVKGSKQDQSKQHWPYKLTLSPNGKRWIKKYKQKQYYHPVPDEIRDNQKKLEAHNRKVWKEWWLPLIGKLKTEEVDRDKEEIRSRWEFRLRSTPKHLSRAKQLRSRELFCDVLLYSLIDEYQVHSGENFDHDKYQQIHQHPYDFLEVFGYVPIEGSDSNAYQLPLDKQRLAEDSDTTIEALIVRFLAEKEADVSERRAYLLQGCLEYLQQFTGGNAEFSTITEQTLKDYRLHVISMMNAGKFGDERAGTIVDTAKQFFRWCMGQSTLISELDPVVANSIHSLLASRGVLTVKKTRKTVKTSGLQEIRDFLASDKKSEMVELYALLAANCSLTPVDLVDFRWTDIENGVLTYRRHKERDTENVPTIKYPLWQRTQELLGKMPRTDARVFPKTASATNDLFRYARDRAGFKSLTLGTIKKTSSTMIGEQFNNDLADYWLGHAPNGVGQRHYIAPSDKNLTKAVRWLESQYFPPEKKKV